MRYGKDLINKQVITLDEGRIVGKVKDIYLDHNLYWMTGIYLGSEGLLRRKEILVARENVVVFGVDVILIKNLTGVIDNKTVDISDWMRLDDLQGREVDTPGGTKLATIGDVVLDGEGRVTGFALSKVTVDGPIADRGVIARDVVIDNGNEDDVMTIDLVKAEQTGLSANPTAESPHSDAA